MKSDTPKTPKSSPVAREQIDGPVTKHHRNALGDDVIRDPHGDGMPSTKPMIANQPRKGW